MMSAASRSLMKARMPPSQSLAMMQGTVQRYSTTIGHGYSNGLLSAHNAHHTKYLQNLRRWHRNFWRLYARRMLDLMAISASAMALRQKASKLEAVAQPKRWQNWERADWEETALASVGASSFQRWWMATQRVITLGALVSPLAILVPLSYVSDRAKDGAWAYALWGIEHAGPTWIKLMQWATTRQDLFSPDFCQYFGKLRDNTTGHSWQETKRILQEELIGTESGATVDKNGRPPVMNEKLTSDPNSPFYKKPGSSFKRNKTDGSGMAAPSSWEDLVRLDPKPIGSGCIAQVYQGELLHPTPHFPANTKIAVKVQHPGIWHKVCVDFYVLGKMAKFLESIPYLNLRMLSLCDTIRQFRDIMIPQLDLTLEADHLNRFNADFSNMPSIDFPKPLTELTTTQVLVETFIEGTPIMDYVDASEPERIQLAHLGLESTLKMIFLHDFVHGDLHPGNILISGTYPKLKLNLLDCGLVLEMGPSQHVNLVKVLGAFTRRNGRLAGELMIDMKAQQRHHQALVDGAGNTLMGGPNEAQLAAEQLAIRQKAERDVQAFIDGIEYICVKDEGQNFIENVGDYITDICTLACRHHVKLEPAFINAALAVEIMEGVAAALHPELRVQQVALPLVIQAELMHRMGLH